MLPPRAFYMIRHGESEANAANLTAGGGFNAPLTAKGAGQAKTLAPYLAQLDVKPSKIYASSMIRAHNTAILINEQMQLGITTHDELRETDFGDWEGRPWREVQPLLDSGLSPPNGECSRTFSTRIQSALDDILAHEDDGNIPMVVAHGGLFWAMGLMYEYGMSHIQNCHLHLFEPHTACEEFPWRVWQYDVEGEILVRSPAPFCATRQEHRIAI